MNYSSDVFAELQRALAHGGANAVLQRAADWFQDQQRYHELFEVRKMQLRRRLGLPLVFHDAGDGLDEPTRRQLEDGLVAACREVGMLLLDAGRVHEGWTYLRPVGDKAAVAKRLSEIQVTDARSTCRRCARSAP